MQMMMAASTSMFGTAGQFQCTLSLFKIHTGTDTDGSQLIFGGLFLVSVEKLAAIVFRNTSVPQDARNRKLWVGSQIQIEIIREGCTYGV